MSAQIIQFVPRPNPNREKALEKQAIILLAHALFGGPAENLIYESSLGFCPNVDTAPCEYSAPTEDSA